ncbi:DUF1906 domain-containing protein [Enterococcus sp. BWM-S5]|uniref:DUF1906 domain-containing protein n=1 Tax=Enterococcus larvae TaxID=2794352 RepID=A0ABS4CFK8_9ENTE|nr:glycoside hydrolase domain-containing protein [Enterococcus larvae]MBP1044921.1 DUF1906 domain-containing protein [Enterococcus larvae]
MADQMVLEGQQWLNKTYGNRTGFKVISDRWLGSTNWATMYALTRALQLELGITATSDAFGPTTLQTVESKFGIISQNNLPPSNVIKIIQTAMYCKGYSAGPINGLFNSFTQTGISSMKQNMGLAKSSSIEPKVFKALLTMDAYVLLSSYGGKTLIRSIQQEFNKRYGHRLDYFYMPCDGIYSRDTQKALVFAIQYEGGMADGVANGNFGPGTQNIVRNQVIQTGSSGRFTYLFKAALIFNGYDTNSISETFIAQDREILKSFQSFSKLSVTGTGTFETWASLLVSTGDPTRRGQACDCVTEITNARAQTLLANGYEIVGRYLTNVEGTSLNKKIQPGELEVIFGNGLKVFPIYQTWGGEASYFHTLQGKKDAIAALEAAENYGFNYGTIIYFAVDYDALGDDITKNIIPHFQSICSQMQVSGGKYRVGIYGPRNVCIKVSEACNVVASFVCGMSTGFSGNLGFSLPVNWAFDQISTIGVGSGLGYIEIDNNIKSGLDDGQGSVNYPIGGTIYEIAVKHNKKVINQMLQVIQFLSAARLDNNWNSHLTFYRYNDYSGIAWDVLASPVSARDAGIFKALERDLETKGELYTYFLDPRTGSRIGLAHLLVTLQSHMFLTTQTHKVIADYTGWLGDLITAWNALIPLKPNVDITGGIYNLVGGLDAGTFSSEDLLQDVDAYNLAKLVESSNDPTGLNALTEYYTQGKFENRLSRFITQRFGSVSNIYDETKKLLSDDTPNDLLGTGILTAFVTKFAKNGTIVEIMSDADSIALGLANKLKYLISIGL